MKYLFILLVFALSILNAKSDNHIITNKYIQGTWLKVTWHKKIRDALGFMDLKEQKFESIQFAGEYYLYHRSNKEHTYNKKQKVTNLYSFKIDTKDGVQWLGLKNGTQIMGLQKPNRWLYFGITKITTKLAKDMSVNKSLIFKEGDILLTLYNSKTKKIVYRKQYRKL